MIKKETKRTGDMINSRKLFDDSEKAHPITEDETIKIEKIHGTLLLIGEEECRRARLDIDQRVRNAVAKWKRVDR